MIPEIGRERVPQALARCVTQVSCAERAPRQAAEIARACAADEEIRAAVVVTVWTWQAAGPARICERSADERFSRLPQDLSGVILCADGAAEFSRRAVYENNRAERQQQHEKQQRLS